MGAELTACIERQEKGTQHKVTVVTPFDAWLYKKEGWDTIPVLSPVNTKNNDLFLNNVGGGSS